MNKENIAWLLIRFIGVILLLASLYFIYQLALNLLAYISIEPLVMEGTNGTKTLRLNNINWTPLIDGIFCIISSIYFLRRGRFMHKLLLSNWQ